MRATRGNPRTTESLRAAAAEQFLNFSAPCSAARALLGILLLAAYTCRAAAPPDAAPGEARLLDDAYEDFYNLDFDQALGFYEKALAGNPNEPAIHNHIAHTLLFREMFRDGALESELVTGSNVFFRRARMEPDAGMEKRFYGELDKSIALCQALLAKNPRDTHALHNLAISYGLRANYGLLVKKSWMAALSDSTKAHKNDTDATQIDPGFYDAKLIQGVYDYILGSLPWTIRAIGMVGGYHGDKERGIETIEEVAAKGKDNRLDADLMLCALYRRDGQVTRAIPLVIRLMDRFPRNYLLRFELAQMYGASGQRQKAIGTLGEIAKRKEENSPGYARIPWEKIYFETGNLEFWFNDLDRALENLQKVTSTPAQLKELDLNTGVVALMRQGQIYDLQNRHNLAVKVYQQAIRFAPEAEAARESQHYINAPYRRAEKS
jgi:tetratricopeptide (TPR) repeat protein